MSNYELHPPTSAPPILKVATRPFHLLTALLATLLILGSLILSIASVNERGQSQQQTQISPPVKPHKTPHVVWTSQPSSTATHTPTPTSPPPSPPSPITPFPSFLSQQLEVLQAHDRFFYHGNVNLPEVALTFDDGPNPYNTPQVLAVLQQYGVKATFFCVGSLVAAYPDLVRQEYAAGHIVGNHSWSHPFLPRFSSDAIQNELTRTSDTIQQAIGVRPTFFRPPYGSFSSRVLTQVNLLGMTTIIWNDEARDWSRPGTGTIINRILGLSGNGAIILLHDGGGDRSQTVAALPSIIESLRQSGYRFVTLQQMMDDLHRHTPAHHLHPLVSTPTTPAAPHTAFSSLILWKDEVSI